MTTTSETKSQRMFALVDEWLASTETKKAFCEEQGINVHTFSYWITKRQRTDSPTGGFTPVDVSGVQPTGQLIITYPKGVTIRMDGANLPLISQLIHLA